MYIKGNRTFVNLDAAEHVETVGSRGISALKLTTHLNRELGIVGDIDLEKFTAPVIPTGQIILSVFISASGDGTERPMTARTEPVPVVGWRVGRDDTASPVFAFKPSGTGDMFLPVGAGQLAGPGGQLYRSTDDAKAAVIAAAQRACDAEHPDAVNLDETKVETPVEAKIVDIDTPKSGGRRHAR